MVSSNNRLCKSSLTFAILAIVLLTFSAGAFCASADLKYPVKKPGHKGGDLTPMQAYQLVLKNSKAFIIDVRTRPEYVLLGHPTMAHHVPLKFWTGKHTSKGYGMKPNQDFSEVLKTRFNPKTDSLVFMCRSGARSCDAANLAVKAGWPTDKVFNMMGGFEGDKLSNPLSAYNGKRVMGGWKNEGLPWTYRVDKKLAYPEAK
jgi:rhodanese-related sulfurtransferase